MKKVLLLVLTLSLAMGLVACGGGTDTDDDDNDDPIVDENAPTIAGIEDVEITIGDSFDALDGVSATDEEDGDLTDVITVSGNVDVDTVGNYTVTYTVVDSDGNETEEERTVMVKGLDGCEVHQILVDGVCEDIPPTEIVIMHGAVNEIDPFHEAYSGTEQLARQERQDEVEEQYNVEIVYKAYPASAAWGPSRVSSIIQSSVSGDHLADIYWVTSDWLQQLVEGDALADVSPYMNTHGANIDDAFYDVGEYQDGIYGFDAGKVTISTGLYYNADLIDSLGVSNPSDLFLDGQWTWSDFETWATGVQTALDAQPDDMYALGGMLSYYAEAMIPLNGGSLINKQSGRVAFNQNPALDTYTFLTNLYNKGLFEPSPQYDAGSPEWMAGKVAVHPGSLWFVNASNRWGGLPFELGFVPYPVADDFTGEYVQPVHGIALMTLASGMSSEKEELVFEVWNELQLWKTDAEYTEDFELSLLTKFDEAKYVESYLAIYDKVYLDIINAIGISAYSENGWTSNINAAIRDGNSRTVVDEIAPIYAAALEDYFGE